MRLYDARTGQVTPVEPTRRLLLLSVAGLEPSGPGLADLRALLTADLIRRLAEMRRHIVLLTWQAEADPAPDGTAPDGPAPDGPAADGPAADGPAADGTAADGTATGRTPANAVAYGADCMALGLRPPGEDDPRLGNPDVQVGGSAANGGVWIRPGGVRRADASGPAGHEPGAGPRLADLGLADPLALRLALLECPYREPAVLTGAGLAEAGRTLAGWRRQVADWATHPSQRMSAAHEERVTGAVADDLDGPAALAALRDLAAADDVTPGAKFETTAHLDQLLGLDLAREVGR
jgi:hypothetical protein